MPQISLIDLEKSLALNQLIQLNSQLSSLNAQPQHQQLLGIQPLQPLNHLQHTLQLQQQQFTAPQLYSSAGRNTVTAAAAAAAAAAAMVFDETKLLSAALVAGNKLLTNLSINSTKQLQQQQQQQFSNLSRYKTELCRQFSENGECKYGEKCQFAHGISELKDITRHPKYKTDFCKTFHSKGFCPYGPRCHFIHDISEKFDMLAAASSTKPTQTPNPGVLYSGAVDVQTPPPSTTTVDATSSSLAVAYPSPPVPLGALPKSDVDDVFSPSSNTYNSSTTSLSFSSQSQSPLPSPLSPLSTRTRSSVSSTSSSASSSSSAIDIVVNTLSTAPGLLEIEHENATSSCLYPTPRTLIDINSIVGSSLNSTTTSNRFIW